MCGIFGFIGNRAAAPLLVDGLRRLEYRGYDSSGIVVKNGSLQVHKKIGKVSELSKILPNHIEGNVGIAHTRWATHGGVTDENAHPHLSQNGDIALVHNGIIDKQRLRKRLVGLVHSICSSEKENGFHQNDSTKTLNLFTNRERARDLGTLCFVQRT